MSYLEKRLAKRMSDPEFRKEWKKSELEYQLDRAAIKLQETVKSRSAEPKRKGTTPNS